MITIRPERSEDYGNVYEVNKCAFNQEDEAQLVERIRQSPNYIPEVSLIAEKEGNIVGHILFSTVEVKTKKTPVTILSLVPMAVLPKFQRQGVGSLLVQKGLSECRRLGFKAVIVVGHPEYYPRFGFVPAKEKGLELPFKAPDEVFLVYELFSGALDGISGLIEYPSAFDEAI